MLTGSLKYMISEYQYGLIQFRALLGIIELGIIYKCATRHIFINYGRQPNLKMAISIIKVRKTGVA